MIYTALNKVSKLFNGRVHGNFTLECIPDFTKHFVMSKYKFVNYNALDKINITRSIKFPKEYT